MTAGDASTDQAAAAAVALHDLDTALSADGYHLEVHHGGSDRLEIRVQASDEACDDCLVPKGVMDGIVTTALERAGIRVGGVDLVYPTD